MTLQIELLNPKARSVLESLEELNLIKIKDIPVTTDMDFKHLISQFRSEKEPPSLEEITAEVEDVRTKRYNDE